MAASRPIEASPALWRGLSHAGGEPSRLYLAPTGFLAGGAVGHGRRLAGGPVRFGLCSVLVRGSGPGAREAVASCEEALAWAEGEGDAIARRIAAALESLTAARPPFAGLSLDRPRIMGIVNVTPDSFSDGGRFFDTSAAIARGLALREAGADILDIGGESTRPGSAPVESDEEIRRVLPVIRALKEQGAIISIDTRHAAVMVAAVEAGATIINDVTALTGDANALRVAAHSGAAVVLMHMRGEPRSMQDDPRYDCAPLDVYDYLAERLAACRAAGITDERLCVDPGIGFGKSVAHNLQILDRLGLYHGLGVAVLLGVSRKSFIGRLSAGAPASQRLGGSLAAALAGVDQGAHILRVHDVAETVQAMTVWQAMREA